MKILDSHTREYLENHLHRLRDILNNYPGSSMEEDPYTETEPFVKDFEEEIFILIRDWNDWKLNR